MKIATVQGNALAGTDGGRQAIGGFLELEFLARYAPLHPHAMEFQSARAAFLALLRAGRPKRVWLPYYLCGTMLASLKQANIDVAFYKIDLGLRIADDIQLRHGDWLVYVNYFGLRTDYAASLLDRFDRNSVVIDCSQALFCAPFDCLATIYSPRKFLGVPDGGLLVSSIAVDEPSVVDHASFERALSLLKRGAFSPEEAYAEHHQAEQTLVDQEPMRMSDLTRRVLASVDYEETRRRRNRNFSHLHAQLGQHNMLPMDVRAVDGALCYPLLVPDSNLRKKLIGERIYIPTYWQDVLKFVSPASDEAYLTQHLVALPCDQRYDCSEMERVSATCIGYLASASRKNADPIPDAEAALVSHGAACRNMQQRSVGSEAAST